MDRSQSEHLSKSVLLEESGNPLLAKTVLWFSSAAFLAFSLWASVTPINEVATAAGNIAPSGQLKKVQHPDGGVIAAFLVHEGEFVSKGQVLVRLDQLAATSLLSETKSSLLALKERKQRLNAVITGKDPEFETTGGLASYQSQIFVQSLLNKRNDIRVLESQIDQQKATRNELQARRKSLREQVSLFKEELKLRRKLYKKGLSSRTLVLALERQTQERQGELNEIPQRIKGVDKKIEEIRAEMAKLDGEVKEEALQELASIAEEHDRLTQVLSRQSQILSQTEIRAPASGIVHGLKTHTVGGVLAPGDVVMDIVPEDTLRAEVHIQPQDIGHIVPGLKATIRFDTFNFARYGGVEGTLVDVSPTTFTDDHGAPYYKGIIDLKQPYIGDIANNHHVKVGMTLSADIRTGEKTIAEYILKPIYLSVKGALTER